MYYRFFLYNKDHILRREVAKRLIIEDIDVIECHSFESLQIMIRRYKNKSPFFHVIIVANKNHFINEINIDKDFYSDSLLLCDNHCDIESIVANCVKEFRRVKEFQRLRNEQVRKLYNLLIIGSSTGGLPTVQKIIQNLSPKITSVIICQHIDQLNSVQMEQSINYFSKQKITLVQTPMNIEKGQMYLLSGGYDYRFIRRSNAVRIVLDADELNLYHPSLNCLLSSCNNLNHLKIGVVMLSGLGNDGANSIHNICSKHIDIIAQNTDETHAPGMASAAIKTGHVTKILSEKPLIQYLKENVA